MFVKIQTTSLEMMPKLAVLGSIKQTNLQPNSLQLTNFEEIASSSLRILVHFFLLV
jgi:hypothetical protein